MECPTFLSYSSPRLSASASVMTSPMYRHMNIPFGRERVVRTPICEFILGECLPHPFFWVLNISRGILRPRWTTRFAHVRGHSQISLHSITAIPGGCCIKASLLYANLHSSESARHSQICGSSRLQSEQEHPWLKWSSRLGTPSPSLYSSTHVKTRGGQGSESTSLATHTGGPSILSKASRKLE